MNIEQAENIVNQYGKLLSTIEPSIYGIAISKLSNSKEEIKTAIQTLILVVDKDALKIQDGLIQAYVYIAQFIEDERVEIAKQGKAILEKNTQEQNIDDLEIANLAVQTINGIKSDMEFLMNEIRLLVG